MNKNILITGASNGLGKELAIDLWHSGFNLCLIGRSMSALQDLLKTINSRPKQKLELIEFNLLNHKQIPDLVKNIEKKISIDVLINNAAIHGPIKKFVNSNIGLWQDAINLNFLTPVLLTKEFINYFEKKKSFNIINISGGGSCSCRPFFSAYASSKIALIKFTEIVASEFAENPKIKINTVAPGSMNTNLMKEIFNLGEHNITPEEFSNAKKTIESVSNGFDNPIKLIKFLISEKSNGISGKIISAVWDNYENWPNHISLLKNSDLYTLRRVKSSKKFRMGR